jgi:hypothetical protein
MMNIRVTTLDGNGKEIEETFHDEDNVKLAVDDYLEEMIVDNYVETIIIKLQ